MYVCMCRIFKFCSFFAFQKIFMKIAMNFIKTQLSYVRFTSFLSCLKLHPAGDSPSFYPVKLSRVSTMFSLQVSCNVLYHHTTQQLLAKNASLFLEESSFFSSQSCYKCCHDIYVPFALPSRVCSKSATVLDLQPCHQKETCFKGWPGCKLE